MNLCICRLKTLRIIKENYQKASREKLLKEVQLMSKARTRMMIHTILMSHLDLMTKASFHRVWSSQISGN